MIFVILSYIIIDISKCSNCQSIEDSYNNKLSPFIFINVTEKDALFVLQRNLYYKLLNYTFIIILKYFI